MRPLLIRTLLRKIYRCIWPIRRPKRLYARGRPPIDVFGSTEVLYRRFQQGELVKGQIVSASLQFPKTGTTSGQSVNRSAFSEPLDVLWKADLEERYEGWGVFQFPVSSLPAEMICRNSSQQYAFFLKHVPLEKMYPHSEIWCDHVPRSDGGYVHPTQTVKKETSSNNLSEHHHCPSCKCLAQRLVAHNSRGPYLPSFGRCGAFDLQACDSRNPPFNSKIFTRWPIRPSVGQVGLFDGRVAPAVPGFWLWA